MCASNLPTLTFLLVLISTLAAASQRADNNGFDLRSSLVPVDEIYPGGPSRDGIPAIDRPRFLSVKDAGFLDGKDQVLGLVRGGEAKAYPVSILNWHEIVNDRIGGERVAVTYCPLCGTGVAVSSEIDGKELTFAVSGLLYNSDMLLYDRETESLWSQLRKQAISGLMKGKSLAALPLNHTTWRAWRQEHPQTMVLSTDTGFHRNYSRDPYIGYAGARELYFPVATRSRRYHPKERVLGLEIEGRFKAYPFVELSRAGRKQIRDRFAGKEIDILFDWANESAQALDQDGNPLASITGFWFAWYAFHPKTEIFTAKQWPEPTSD